MRSRTGVVLLGATPLAVSIGAAGLVSQSHVGKPVEPAIQKSTLASKTQPTFVGTSAMLQVAEAKLAGENVPMSLSKARYIVAAAQKQAQAAQHPAASKSSLSPPRPMSGPEPEPTLGLIRTGAPEPAGQFSTFEYAWVGRATPGSNNVFVYVYAGETGDLVQDPLAPAVLIVTSTRTPDGYGFSLKYSQPFLAPGAVGGLSIQSVANGVVNLTSASGQSYNFSLATDTYVS